MKKKLHITYGKRSLAVTLVLILAMIGASFAALRWVNQIEEEECFSRLQEEASHLARNIERTGLYDVEKLKVMADLAATYDDLSDPDLWQKIDDSPLTEGMSRLEILLPDDSVLTAQEHKRNVKNGASFAEVSAAGAHITDRQLDENDNYVVRNYAPIIRDGQTVAMLCCVIDLPAASESMKSVAYGGKGALYIIDGNTGEFLMDTWHSELASLQELGERQLAPGYDPERLQQGIYDGKKDFMVFTSETTGEYLYFYYEPLQINQWRIAVSVPEEVVFATARTIRQALIIFLVFEILCFALYFLWMLRNSQREARNKQRQLDTLYYINDIEKLLFNAHEKKANISLALEKIGYITAAQRVVFQPLGYQSAESFIWNRHEARREKDSQESSDYKDKQIAEALAVYFAQGHTELEAETPEELKEKLPQISRDGIKNLLAIPVSNIDGILYGTLISYNQDDLQMGMLILKSISFSFSMFCRNLFVYNTLKQQSEKDALTGMNNRNRYEADLPGMKDRCSNALACIYIDVNGLHRLNNLSGHEAGDLMLQAVGACLVELFGTRYTYRIGGDEFLIFLPDAESADHVKRQCDRLVDALNEENIHAAVGFQWACGDFSTAELVKEAEKKMYIEKTKFYNSSAYHRR